MKDFFFDTVLFKLLFGSYVMASAATAILLENGLYIHLLYWSLAGQILATLIDIKGMAERNQLKDLKLNKVIAVLLEWIIGPTIGLVLTSYLQGTDAFIFKYAFLSFLIGAFWEIAWLKIKKKFSKLLEDYNLSDGEDTTIKTLDGENNPPKPPGQ